MSSIQEAIGNKCMTIIIRCNPRVSSHYQDSEPIYRHWLIDANVSYMTSNYFTRSIPITNFDVIPKRSQDYSSSKSRVEQRPLPYLSHSHFKTGLLQLLDSCMETDATQLIAMTVFRLYKVSGVSAMVVSALWSTDVNVHFYADDSQLTKAQQFSHCSSNNYVIMCTYYECVYIVSLCNDLWYVSTVVLYERLDIIMEYWM